MTGENVEFIRAAVAAGVRHIDTAHLYTGGDSEAAIGAACPEGALIATKGGYEPGEGEPSVLSSQIEQSLQRLRRDSIDLYYLHRVDPQTPLETTLQTLAEHRDRGIIKSVGLSEVSIEQIEQARELLPIAAVQNDTACLSGGMRRSSITARARGSCSCRSFCSGALRRRLCRRSLCSAA